MALNNAFEERGDEKRQEFERNCGEVVVAVMYKETETEE